MGSWIFFELKTQAQQWSLKNRKLHIFVKNSSFELIFGIMSQESVRMKSNVEIKKNKGLITRKPEVDGKGEASAFEPLDASCIIVFKRLSA